MWRFRSHFPKEDLKENLKQTLKQNFKEYTWLAGCGICLPDRSQRWPS
jgi:hypothetical protein